MRLGPDVGTFELHGGLGADDQDAALRPAARPRVILATNIAETTLTVPDVRIVVDSGWQKVARYDAARGIDSLDTERVSRDAADQRAGRAGRLAPGRAIRLWDEHARLRPHRQPDIARVDLASPVLDLLAWGANPRTFEWFEAPRPDLLDAALVLLQRLGAVDAAGHLTPSGRQLQRVPLHPRLARLLVAAGGVPEAASAVALLSDRRRQPASATATACDLWAAAHESLPSATQRVAKDVRAVLRANSRETLRDSIGEDAFRRAVLAAYPDRVARRRAAGSDRVLLASGTGARLGRESGVVGHEYLVAIDVGASSADPSGEATIRMACGLEREWITPTSITVEHWFDREAGRVRARRVARYDAIELSSADVPVDPLESGRLLTAAILAQGPRDADRHLLARCRVAGLDVSFDTLVHAAASSARSLDEVRLADGLPPHVAQRLSRDAPVDLALPSGRRAKLDYREDGRIVAGVKLQELFGLADTPRIGPSGVPITFELLAPNGRPVQVTSDLRSFWTTGYQEVRRELRARYPRHPWPEEPWTARPTHRTVRRS
jgi:ATP-dependent helicase HrpB